MDKPESTSPCVRNCCLNEQDICLGCFRTLDEILAWRAMTLSEQQLCRENIKLRQREYLKRYPKLQP